MPLVNIIVGPADRTIATGAALQFRAVGIDNKGAVADITATVTWASTDEAVATVAPGGLATGVAPGAATIRATAAGVTGSAILAVEVTLVSMEITPNDVVLLPGDMTQFTATGTYSDLSTEDLTAPAAFVSSDPSVVTVDNTGLAKGIAAGVAVIEARYGGLVAATSAGVTQGSNNPYAELLAQAQMQMLRLASGQAIVAIETPQLGRVVYNQTNIADLQRLIDYLSALVYPESAATMRRRPISIEACP